MTHILSETANGVLRITMDRTEKLNAITIAMYEEMTRLLTRAGEDDAIHCVLITGGDQVFTAGNDLKDFLQAPPSDESGGVMEFLNVLARFSKPLGAAVSGAAVGIGVTLLFHCDFVVSASGATYSAPFVNLGLTPEAGSTYLAPRQIGQKATNRLFLLGETLSATEALDIGLISHVVEGSALAAAGEIAEKLATRSPLAVQETKRLLNLGSRQPVADQMAEEGAVFGALVKSDYCRALFTRFLGG